MTRQDDDRLFKRPEEDVQLQQEEGYTRTSYEASQDAQEGRPTRLVRSKWQLDMDEKQDAPEGWKKPEDKKEEKRMSAKEREKLIEQLTREMKSAAKMLEFEHAAYLRDKIKNLKGE